MENDVVYFSVNNWFCGRDYPDTRNFRKWLGDDLNQNFRSDEWCKKNKLCVYYGTVDMSQNYTVSAPREWVEKNCPELLTDKEYSYKICTATKDKFKYETIKKKYSDFVYTPEEGDELPDNDSLGDMPFREYCEENFGSEYYETHWWGDDCDDEDNEEEDEEDE
jgi:hypothetical protein